MEESLASIVNLIVSYISDPQVGGIAALALLFAYGAERVKSFQDISPNARLVLSLVAASLLGVSSIYLGISPEDALEAANQAFTGVAVQSPLAAQITGSGQAFLVFLMKVAGIWVLELFAHKRDTGK